MPKRLPSVAKIAAHLGVNPDTIYTWIIRKVFTRTSSCGCESLWRARWMKGYEQERRARMFVMIISTSFSRIAASCSGFFPFPVILIHGVWALQSRSRCRRRRL